MIMYSENAAKKFGAIEVEATLQILLMMMMMIADNDIRYRGRYKS